MQETIHTGWIGNSRYVIKIELTGSSKGLDLSYKHTERQQPMLVNGDAWKSVPDSFPRVIFDQHWPLPLILGVGIPLMKTLWCHEPEVFKSTVQLCFPAFSIKLAENEQLQSLLSPSQTNQIKSVIIFVNPPYTAHSGDECIVPSNHVWWATSGICFSDDWNKNMSMPFL